MKEEEEINKIEQLINHDFKPSEYQQAIFDFIKHGKGNAVISAVAGSGKTTTIAQSLKFIPLTENSLYLAFNKDIVSSMKDKFGYIRNVTFSTLHGYGFSTFKNYFPNVVVDNYKYGKILRAIYNYLRTNNDKKIEEYGFSNSQLINLDKFLLEENLPEYDDHKKYSSRVISLCNLCRLMLIESEGELEIVAENYDISTRYGECKRAIMLMKLGRTTLKTVDYTDMIYLPIVLNLSGNKYNYVFIDECQDLNIAQRELMFRCLKENGRFIAVGDPKQAIYGFAGADIVSFNTLVHSKNTKSFPLSVCYRCDESIINLAQTLVPEIKFHEKNGVGIVNYDAQTIEISDGDMVLSRNTYPLIKMCFEFLKLGIKATVRGKDIGSNLIELIDDTKETEITPMYDKLYIELEKTKKSVIKKHDITEDEALEHQTFVNHKEKIQIIELLSSNSKNCLELINKIRNIFSDNGEGIQLSTIHKAKGLESNRVFILHKESMPSKNAKTTWQIEQEYNILYVAYTRAKNYLGFVTDFDAYKDIFMYDKSKSVNTSTGGFVSSPGMSIYTDLELFSEIEMDTKIGLKTVLYKFKDDNGNIFTKFQNIPDEFYYEENKNKKINCFITIKEHREYRGVKENSISRMFEGTYHKKVNEEREKILQKMKEQDDAIVTKSTDKTKKKKTKKKKQNI